MEVIGDHDMDPSAVTLIVNYKRSDFVTSLEKLTYFEVKYSHLSISVISGWKSSEKFLNFGNKLQRMF